MSRKILINVGPYQTRAAIVDGGVPIEVLHEIEDSEKFVGCIFKGKVTNVLPGTQSAFADIGIHKDAYLTLASIESGKDDDLQDIYQSPIQDLLKRGQEIVLQVLKEPTPTKGPRSTMTVSLPGRYLVFMPTVDHVGVSRRITHDKERDRLRAIGKRLVPKGSVVIFRTASEGVDEKILAADITFLLKLWGTIDAKAKKAPPRSLLHRDIPLPLKLVRDYFTDDVDEFIIDSEEEYRHILDFCDFLSPLQRASMEVYRGTQPIFDAYDVEKELQKALERKIWLDSGGYIFIEKTEAMYSIDVNSGRFSGGADLEETVFKVNLEAAKVIARQIRLRNLSGMIVIDFIDMEDAKHRREVLKCLKEAFRGDRNRPNVLDFSELGLVQMTRRRASASLGEILQAHCPCCEGTGRVMSLSNLINIIRRRVLEEAQRYETEGLVVHAPQRAVDFFCSGDASRKGELEERCGRKLQFRPRKGNDLDTFQIEPVLQNKPQRSRRRREKESRGTQQ